MPFPSDNDNDLIKSCVSRDPRAWTALIRLYGPVVLWAVERQLRRLGRGLAERDDLFQSVWSRIWTDNLLIKLKDAKSLKPWLASVAVNETRNYIRSQTKRGTVQQVSLEEPGLADRLPDAGQSPENALYAQEVGTLLGRELAHLSSRERLIVRLYFEEEHKTARIASLLDMPVGTVLSVISRIRQKIRKALEEKGIK